VPPFAHACGRPCIQSAQAVSVRTLCELDFRRGRNKRIAKWTRNPCCQWDCHMPSCWRQCVIAYTVLISCRSFDQRRGAPSTIMPIWGLVVLFVRCMTCCFFSFGEGVSCLFRDHVVLYCAACPLNRFNSAVALKRFLARVVILRCCYRLSVFLSVCPPVTIESHFTIQDIKTYITPHYRAIFLVFWGQISWS